MNALIQLLFAATAMTAPVIKVQSIDGRKMSLPISGRTTCLIFVAPDCPIANRLAPEIQRIVSGNPKVAFFMAYPQASTTKAAAIQHRKAFGFTAPAFLDPKFKLAKFARAKVTPEAVLYDAKGKPVYRGRINDLYTEHNVTLPKPTRNDLRDAIAAVLSGRPIAEPYAAPVGCPIAFR